MILFLQPLTLNNTLVQCVFDAICKIIMDILITILNRKCLNENSPERIRINKLTLLTKQKLTLALLALIYFPRACTPFISAKSWYQSHKWIKRYSA